MNSNEWHLDTSIAAAGRSKILQFVVYTLSSSFFILVYFILLFIERGMLFVCKSAGLAFENLLNLPNGFLA